MPDFEILQERLKLLPSLPGVYLMKDKNKKIIYVGKSKTLRKRVTSYFANYDNLLPRLKKLVDKIRDFDFIVTDSEVEALLVECTLIKKYQPHYNIRFRDDRQYPFLKLSVGEEYPKLVVARRLKKDDARYFGPFTDKVNLYESLRVLREVFLLPACEKFPARPCLNYHMKRCLAPCKGNVSRDDYLANVEQAELFLSGRGQTVLKNLRQEMESSAESLNFERAAVLRDKIKTLEKITERQKVFFPEKDADLDFIAIAQDNEDVCCQVLLVRAGRLWGENHFFLEDVSQNSPEEIITSFIKQYYVQVSFLPEEVIISCSVEEKEVLEEWLSSVKKKKVKLLTAQKGVKKELLEMAGENAFQRLRIYQEERNRKEKKGEKALLELAKQLKINKPFHKIECFDISNISGQLAVGSKVCFKGGYPFKKDYRHYRLKTAFNPDDYGMMRELLERRFKNREELPDLVVIDGGLGHLNTGLDVLGRLNLKIDVISLAKEQEEIFLPDFKQSLLLDRTSPALSLLRHLRDEAHRFAITYHRKLRSKELFSSKLEDIAGIGEKTKLKLLKHFGSLAKIQEVTLEKLSQITDKRKGKLIYDYYHRN